MHYFCYKLYFFPFWVTYKVNKNQLTDIPRHYFYQTNFYYTKELKWITLWLFEKTMWNLLFYNIYKNIDLNFISNYPIRKYDVPPRDHIWSNKQVDIKWVLPAFGLLVRGYPRKLSNSTSCCNYSWLPTRNLGEAWLVKTRHTLPQDL